MSLCFWKINIDRTMEKTKISLTNFKEFSPDETPSWVMNVIINEIDKEYSKFSEPIFEILHPRA